MKDQGYFGNLHPFLKLLLLTFVMLAGSIVVFVAGLIIGAIIFGGDVFTQLGAPDMDINLLRYIQIITHLGLFIISALVFAYLVGNGPLPYYRGRQIPQWWPLFLSALIILASVPMVYYLSHINQQMALPESLHGLEQWMRRTEDEAAHITETLLSVSTIWGLLFNLFMIAVIPAIGEEFIFRGALQRIFHQWTGNVHVAVVIAAVLFSAMHMQFYGFLPRLLLGLLMGYMFVRTGNIWVPVFAHFFNNAAAVTLYYYAHTTGQEIDPDSMGEVPFAPVVALISLVLVVLLFRWLNPGKENHDRGMQTDA